MTAAGIVMNGSKLQFAYADRGGSLKQVTYNINHAASWKGIRLVPEGAIHIGGQVTRILGIKMGANRQALLVGCANGSLGLIEPVWEAKAVDRLTALQGILGKKLEHTAGLNPRAFRRRYVTCAKPLGGGDRFGRPLTDPECLLKVPAQQSTLAPLCAPIPNNMLDGSLLMKFSMLHKSMQQDLAGEALAEIKNEEPDKTADLSMILEDLCILNQEALEHF